MNIANLVRAAREAEAKNHTAKLVQLCREAIRQDARCVDALLMLGSLSARQGRGAEAAILLRRAASLDPQSYDAARWLATLLVGQGGGAEAVAFGQTAVRLHPGDADAHAALGLAALGHGDSTLAIESFEHAIELSPQMAGAHHNLGVAYQREESFDEAIDSFRRAISLAPTVLESYLHLGRCFLRKNLGDEALDCGVNALRLNPKSMSAQRLVADATYLAVQGKNGMLHIRRAMELHPESGFPHALMASRLQENGDFAAAEASIEKAIELQQVQGFAYYLLANNRKFREEDRERVERIAQIGAAALPTVEARYFHFGLGKMLDDLHEFERAMASFDAANRDFDHAEASAALQDARAHKHRIRCFIELFTQEFTESLKPEGLESDAPIFIFGMPRSGTTLIEQIVSRHSSVGAGGELFYWRDTARRIVDLKAGRIDHAALRSSAGGYLEHIRTEAPGHARVTDKFPSNYIYLGLLQAVFPRATFIHARRHPVDTCLSMYMRPFKNVHEFGQTRRRLVETYRLYQESLDHWHRKLPPGRILDVDYELLVQNPEQGARRIIEHCGLDWEEACLRPEAGDRRVLTFSMWQVRQPVYTTSVERWRNYEPWLGELRELLDEDARS